MKIAVFAYNFPHGKTYAGLVQMCINGFKPDLVLAADPVPLTFAQSKVRVAPKGLDFPHPKDVARYLGIPYVVVPHNSPDAAAAIRESRIELGVILGARILKQPTIDACELGILNMHPGMLPANRGLDNLKWAIFRRLPQGVSVHFIDRFVDRGWLVDQRTIPVFVDDSLVDLTLRLQSLEQVMLTETLLKLDAMGAPQVRKLWKQGLKAVGEGEKFDCVPPDLERNLFSAWDSYRARFSVGRTLTRT